MKKIAKKLKHLTEKKERIRASVRHYMTFSSTACTIYVAVMGFEVVYGNNPKKAACSPWPIASILVVGAICLLLILINKYPNYIKKQRKRFIIKLTRRNLKKKRELIKLGKRQEQEQISHNDPKFYSVGQLSDGEISTYAKKKVTELQRVLACTLLLFFSFVILLAINFLSPCGPRSPSPSK
ncbi:hypothetical protein ACFX2I_026321 [Malus domestica]